MSRLFVFALIMLLAAPLHAAELRVVTSFSILGDLIRQIGGERVEVIELIGPDGDLHTWQPRPSDARTVKEADLVILHGLGLDTQLERLAESVGVHHIMTATENVAPLEYHAGHDHSHHDHDHHDHGNLDPHAWQDVNNVRQHYIVNIAAALIARDPDGRDAYTAQLLDYERTLHELDAEIRSRLGTLPQEKRKVVTSHDAFAYFGAAYDIHFLAAASASSHGEPSAAALARLIRQLRETDAPVVFLENLSNPRLIKRIRAETGARLGGTLYSDALSRADGPAATYVAMMHHNLETLMAGLAP